MSAMAELDFEVRDAIKTLSLAAKELQYRWEALGMDTESAVARNVRYSAEKLAEAVGCSVEDPFGSAAAMAALDANGGN
jgi:hypothetical protein